MKRIAQRMTSLALALAMGAAMRMVARAADDSMTMMTSDGNTSIGTDNSMTVVNSGDNTGIGTSEPLQPLPLPDTNNAVGPASLSVNGVPSGTLTPGGPSIPVNVNGSIYNVSVAQNGDLNLATTGFTAVITLGQTGIVGAMNISYEIGNPLSPGNKVFINFTTQAPDGNQGPGMQ